MLVPSEAAAVEPRTPTYFTRSLALLGIITFALLGIWTEVRFLRSFPPHSLPMADFMIYVRAYMDASQGHDPYAIRRVGPAFLYPPPALLVVGPFAAVAPSLARHIVYGLVNVVLLVSIVRGIARRYGYSLRQTWWWYALGCAFGPTIELLTIGQINMFAAWGICCTFLYAETLPVLAGAGLALAIATKTTPAVFLLYLALTRRWTALAWSFGTLGTLGIAAAVLFGVKPFLTYVDVLRNLSHTYMPGGDNIQALVSLLNYHGWLPLTAMPVAQRWLMIFLVGECVTSGWLAWRRHTYEPFFIIVALSTMIAPTVMWYHHYVFALAPLFVWMAWHRMRPSVVVWCCLVMTIIQLDRWMLTDGLLSQAAFHLSIVGVLVDQSGLSPQRLLRTRQRDRRGVPDPVPDRPAHNGDPHVSVPVSTR